MFAVGIWNPVAERGQTLSFKLEFMKFIAIMVFSESTQILKSYQKFMALSTAGGFNKLRFSVLNVGNKKGHSEVFDLLDFRRENESLKSYSNGILMAVLIDWFSFSFFFISYKPIDENFWDFLMRKIADTNHWSFCALDPWVLGITFAYNIQFEDFQ